MFHSGSLGLAPDQCDQGRLCPTGGVVRGSLARGMTLVPCTEPDPDPCPWANSLAQPPPIPIPKEVLDARTAPLPIPWKLV